MSYPRTPHLPFSPTIFSDDIINKNINALKIFENNDIVILEKIEIGKYQYFVSRLFNSTNLEDLKEIYKNLLFVKEEIIKMVESDK